MVCRHNAKLIGVQYCTSKVTINLLLYTGTFIACKMDDKIKCEMYAVCFNLLVLQGCYDAGVVYLKENAAGLIVVALIMAVILVCICCIIMVAFR